jgi:hypothetical protein
MNVKFEFPVDCDEDRSVNITLFYLGKCLVALGSPSKWFVFSCKESDGRHNPGVIADETSVELGKAVENLDVLDVPRSRHCDESFDFLWIKEFAFCGDDIPLNHTETN